MSIHHIYEKLSDPERDAVDAGFDAMLETLRDHLPNHRFSTIDPAERLVEAMAVYITDSDTNETVARRNVDLGVADAKEKLDKQIAELTLRRKALDYRPAS